MNGGEANDYKYYYNEGKIYFENKEYDKAIECFTKAIELKSDYAIAYTYRGIAYSGKQEYDKAIEDYSKTIELEPEHANYYNRGIAYYYKKEYNKAIEDYSKAIELMPDYSKAYYNRGIVYADKQENDKAIEDYSKAIELKPDYAEAYNNRGIAFKKNQQLDKAIEDYSKAIELKSDYALAYMNKGNALKAITEYEKAKFCFEEARKIYSIDKEAYKLEKIEDNIKELDGYIEASKQKENKFTKIINDTKVIFSKSEMKKKAFLEFIIPRERKDSKNYLEVLRRWNSYTPIIADNFHVSKGGGYFFKINGKGIVIDPGFNFIDNFKGCNHSFSEIDMVLITHAHNDHTADIESIITLLHKYNENIKSTDNLEDNYTVEYDLAQRYGDKWSEIAKDDYKKRELINEEFKHSPRRKIIDIFITASTFKKYVGMFELMKSADYKVHIIEAGYEKKFEDDSFSIKAIKAKHFDIISDDSSVGFIIEFDDNVILYTGDTGVDEKLVENYTQISNGFINKNIVLLAHLGGFKDYEVGYKEEEGYKSFYKNHLGRLGLVEINNILKPKVCLISEFGEEFKENRIEFTNIMDNLYEGDIKFLPADIGLRLNFDKSSCKVYGITQVDVHTSKINSDDIEPINTDICMLRKDYSLHYYDNSGNVKESDLTQILREEYEKSKK